MHNKVMNPQVKRNIIKKKAKTPHQFKKQLTDKNRLGNSAGRNSILVLAYRDVLTMGSDSLPFEIRPEQAEKTDGVTERKRGRLGRQYTP